MEKVSAADAIASVRCIYTDPSGFRCSLGRQRDANAPVASGLLNLELDESLGVRILLEK
jgi:hypothetical protein